MSERLIDPLAGSAVDQPTCPEKLKRATLKIFYMQIWLLPIACLLVMGIVGMEPQSTNLMLQLSPEALLSSLNNRWPLVAGVVLLVLHIGRVITYIEQRVLISG